MNDMIDALVKELTLWSENSFQEYTDRRTDELYLLAAESYGAWLAFQNVPILISAMKLKKHLEEENQNES